MTINYGFILILHNFFTNRNDSCSVIFSAFLFVKTIIQLVEKFRKIWKLRFCENIEQPITGETSETAVSPKFRCINPVSIWGGSRLCPPYRLCFIQENFVSTPLSACDELNFFWRKCYDGGNKQFIVPVFHKWSYVVAEK